MQKRNWKEYNENLVRRGELYISLDFIESWEEELSNMNNSKVGRPFQYPQTFMRFLGFLHVAFLPLRQMEGFLRKLSEHVPGLRVIDYSTICKRLKKLDIELPIEDLGDNLIIAIDSSGMKVTNRFSLELRGYLEKRVELGVWKVFSKK
jgi:hypothetical protein